MNIKSTTQQMYDAGVNWYLEHGTELTHREIQTIWPDTNVLRLDAITNGMIDASFGERRIRKHENKV